MDSKKYPSSSICFCYFLICRINAWCILLLYILEITHRCSLWFSENNFGRRLYLQIVFSVVEDSFVKQSMIVKGYRKMGRGRGSLVRYRYSHYFLRLREGKPPKHYYPPPETGYDKMENYIKKQRQRRVILAL